MEAVSYSKSNVWLKIMEIVKMRVLLTADLPVRQAGCQLPDCLLIFPAYNVTSRPYGRIQDSGFSYTRLQAQFL